MASEPPNTPDPIAESGRAFRDELRSIPLPTREELENPPAPEPEPAPEPGPSPAPAAAEPAAPPAEPPPAEGDDYDEEDFVEPPPSAPPQETKPPSATATEPPVEDAWTPEKVKEQYPTDEARVKALADNKTHISRLTAELKAVKEGKGTSPAPAAEPPAPTTPPPDERELIKNAVFDIARQDPEVGKALNHLKVVGTTITALDKEIDEANTKIAAEETRLERLGHALAFHEEQRTANPEDVATLDTIRSIREAIRDTRDRRDDLRDRRAPVIARRDHQRQVWTGANQILTELGANRVRATREQAEAERLDAELQTQHLSAWDAAFPRVADHFKIPQELRAQVQADLAREAAAEIRPEAGVMIENFEAWLMERMPRRQKFLESVRGKAFSGYVEDKRQDANLQPAPPVDKARAKPEPEPQPGDIQGEMKAARRRLAQELRGSLGRRA